MGSLSQVFPLTTSGGLSGPSGPSLLNLSKSKSYSFFHNYIDVRLNCLDSITFSVSYYNLSRMNGHYLVRKSWDSEFRLNASQLRGAALVVSLAFHGSPKLPFDYN